jgi:DNA primase
VTSLVPSPATRRLLESRLLTYERQLGGSPEASAYLESRALTNKTLGAFRVGFVAKPLLGDERYRGRVAIPYLTPSGCVGMKFRAIKDDAEVKYLKDVNEPNRIFNTSVLIRAQFVVITEGEFDCMSVSQAGLDAVGVPGARNWKPEWNRVFFQRDVVVVAHGDPTGREWAERVAINIDCCRIVYMPDGEDVNSMLQSKGESWIREKVLG